MAETPEQRELNLVGKVELRIALADTDAKLQSILQTYLPPLLLKLASGSKSVRNKVLSVCQHVSTRIKAPSIQLPVDTLLKQYKTVKNPLVRRFDLLYVQQGIDRLPVPNRLELLPTLLTGFDENYQDSTENAANLFYLLLKLLHSLNLPARSSTEDLALRTRFGFKEGKRDAKLVASWLGRLILFSTVRRTGKRYWGLDVHDCDFLQVHGKEEAWRPEAGGLNLIETKVRAAKFLASGAFETAEQFLPALFASADPNSRLSEIGDDIMKRASPLVSLEDPGLMKKLLNVYLGTRGPQGSLPASANLKTKILTFLCKSKTSSSFVAKNIQLVKESLMSAAEDDLVGAGGPIKQGLEASKLRRQIFAYINWVARISSSADIEAFAPSMVGQIRNYIEIHGWPQSKTEGPANANELSARNLGYESVGLLAAACPSQLLLEPNLDLLRWLLASLASDPSGKETTICIEQALSSVIRPFASSLDDEIEASLTKLLLHHVSLNVGDILGSNEKIVRSTRFVAVRFANRCLPFCNTTARWIDVLALNAEAGERNEVLEEGSKGLDPYWHRTLNIHENQIPSTETAAGTATSKTQELPEFPALITRFYGWSETTAERTGDLQSLTKKAADTAIRFCHAILLHQALTSKSTAPLIDTDWVLQLTAMIANDANARQTLKDYLKQMSCSNSTSQRALERFLQVLFLSITSGSGTETSQSADIGLELLSLVPDLSVSPFAAKAVFLADTIYSNDKVVRIAASNIFGILGSHHQSPHSSVRDFLAKLGNTFATWESAVGSDILRIHGAILATSFWVTRTAYRGRALSDFKQRLQHLLQVSLDIMSSSRDTLLLEAATSTIAELSAFAVITLDSLPAPHNAESVLRKLKQIGQEGDETAILALGYLGMHFEGHHDARPSTQDPVSDIKLTNFLSVVEILYALHEVRRAEVQFAVGAALSCSAVGWSSGYLVGKLDVEGPPPNPKTDEASPNLHMVPGSSSQRLGLILDRVLKDCKSTKPALRQATVIWLLCLVQYCGQSHKVQSRLKECQVAFKGFLSDKESLNRETAARGLTFLYEKGNRAVKDDLVRDLVSSFTGDNAGLAGTVSDQTELFEPGALPTGNNASITTYKDIMSLAAEVGDPSLVYRFMSMASNNAIWTSRSAFGHFGLSNILSDSSVDGYLAQNPKLYPALFRYRFDPNSNVRSSMNDIWKALVKDPTAVVDKHFESIMEDLLKNIVGREWRTRQASCAAVADLVQGRLLEKYEKYLNQIWTLTYKVCDDIKGSVREAAQALARVLAGMLTHSLEAGDTSTRNIDLMLSIVLPFLFSTSGLESTSQEIQAFSLGTLLDIIKSSKSKTLRPYVPNIVGQLVALLSSFEHEGINYLHLNADKYGVTTQQIDDARLTGVKGSPLMEAIERCLDALDTPTMTLLRESLENAIKTAVGLPSKVGSSRILVSLSTRHSFTFKDHADHFLRLTRKQLLDRNDTVSSAYATACGYLSRMASDAEILELVHFCKKLYFDSDNDRHRAISGDVVYAVSKHATDRFNALAEDILPFVFIAQHDPLERAAIVYKRAWDENVGGSRAVLLYVKDIVDLAIRYLDSPRWSIKHTSAFAIAKTVGSMGSEISDSNAEVLWPALEKALGGKTWEGKEKILKAFVEFARRSKMITSNEKVAAQMQANRKGSFQSIIERFRLSPGEGFFSPLMKAVVGYLAYMYPANRRSRLQKIMLRESKRNNIDYRQEALACLGDFIELRVGIDLFTQILEITQPIILDALDESTKMDVDSPFGGPSSKSMQVIQTVKSSSSANVNFRSELTLAHALSSLLRSIDPKCRIDQELTSALGQVLDLIKKATARGGSRTVQDEIYSAEKGLFDKMQDVRMNGSLDDTLIEYAQSLSGSRNQVEQSRLKAAEVGVALCPLARKGSRMREILKQQLTQLQAQERSVPVQQCLERGLKSLSR